MTASPRSLVVIGIGNILLGDDGVGIRVVEDLRAQRAHDPRSLPDHTRLVDGGTRGGELIDELRDACGVVLVDAMRLGGQAGAVRLLHDGAIGEVVRPEGEAVCPSIGDLLAMAGMMACQPGSMTLVGIEVHAIEPGLHLSPAVDAAVGVASDAVCEELWRMARIAEVTS